MKPILFLEHFNKIGGGELFLVELLEKLDKSRFSPYCLSPMDKNIEPRLSRIDGLNLLSIRCEHFRSLNPVKMRKNSIVVYELIKAIKRNKIKCVFSNSTPGRAMARIIKAKYHIPILSYMHDDHTNAPTMAWLLKDIDKIIANSHCTRTSILRKTRMKNSKVVVIPNGVDFEIMENMEKIDLQTEFSIKNGRVIIGIFGRLADWKGHEILLEIASRIISQNHDCHFLIVGKGEQKYESELREYARLKNLDKHLTFTGFRDDVLQVMSSVDIVTNLSTRPEPFGRTIIEAGALGKPVVAFNMGGPAEIIEDGETGILVEFGDLCELESALLSLINHPLERERLGANARTRVKARFSLEKVVASIEYLLDSIH